MCAQLLQSFGDAASQSTEMGHLLVGLDGDQLFSRSFQDAGRSIDAVQDPATRLMLAFVVAAQARTSSSSAIVGVNGTASSGRAREQACHALEEKAIDICNSISVRQRPSLASVIALTFAEKLLVCGNQPLSDQSAFRKLLNNAVLDLAQHPELLPQGVGPQDVTMIYLSTIFTDALLASRHGENPDFAHADVEEVLGEEAAMILNQAPDAAAFRTAIGSCANNLQIISVCQMTMIGATRFFATNIASRKARRRRLDLDAFNRTVDVLEAVLLYALAFAEEAIPGIHQALPQTAVNAANKTFTDGEIGYLRIILDSAVGILINLHMEISQRFTWAVSGSFDSGPTPELSDLHQKSTKKLVSLIRMHAYFNVVRDRSVLLL